MRGRDESPKKDEGRMQRPFAALAPLRNEMRQEAGKKAALSGARKAASAAAEPKRARATSDEDLFLAEVAGVAPIEARGGRVGSPPVDPTKRVARPSDDAEVLAELADLCGGDGRFDISDSDEYIEGLADGIDRRLLRRLRAGEYAVQGHIDLHGLSREEARDKVARFLTDSRRAGRRCVLIVHGRGRHSKDQIPVLKQAVRSWLERGQLARSVLAFATARPNDGGAGAMYVLLRR